MVCLVTHTPLHYTRMVSVATDHLLHLLFLNLNGEFLVQNTWGFLICYNSVFIGKVINKLVVLIMSCSNEVIIKVFSYIFIIHFCYPFWYGITQPGIFLLTVSSMDHHFFTIHIEKIIFIIPHKPTKTQRTRIDISHSFFIKDMRINFVEVWIII